MGIHILKLSLHLKVRKSLVGFSHTVRIFFFLESSAFTLTGCNNFIGQFFCHAPAVSLTAITDQPFHAQRNFPVGSHLCRNLKSSATNTTTANFHRRSYVGKSSSPNIVSILSRLLAYPIDRVVSGFRVLALESGGARQVSCGAQEPAQA